MPNYFWYCLLAVASTILFTLALWKAKNPRLVALYLFMSGLIYAFEFVILVLYKSYVYQPGILAIAYFDNIMGAVFSDAFIVPMLSAFIVAYRINLLGMAIAAVIIMAIEEFFTSIGIYQHYWWKTIYSGSGLIIAFIIAQKWWSLLKNTPGKLVGFTTLYFINITIFASVTFILCGIMHKYLYAVNWYPDPYRGHVAFATIHIFALSLIFTSLIIYKIKWPWVALSLAAITGLDYSFLELRILQLTAGWSLLHMATTYLLLYLTGVRLKLSIITA